MLKRRSQKTPNFFGEHFFFLLDETATLKLMQAVVLFLGMADPIES